MFRKSILFLIRLQNVHLLYRACNINILLFDYRGYGKSTGTPSETGLYTDAQAVYDYVRTRTDLNQDKIFLFGRSLGGAVALHLGKNKINNKYPNSSLFFFRKASHLAQTNTTSPLYCVILENTFTSISDMAKRLFQVFVLDYVPIWCYKNVVEFRRRCFFSSNIFLIFNIVFINHKNSSYRSTSTFSFR